METELSATPQYTIKFVSSQTGIRPVTIRAWERRYNLLNPYRSENRYRLYSEQDIAILLWVKKAIEDGLSISNAVMKLKMALENGEVITKKSLWMSPPKRKEISPRSPQYYSNKLTQALFNHNENDASNVFQESYAFFDILTVFEEIIIPTLHTIGDAWQTGRIRISDEHFASNYIKAKLMSLLQTFSNHRNSPKIIIGCAPFEHHEIGCLFLSILLRREGYWIEYLGPDIPIDDLVDYVSYTKPAMIILSATLESNARELIPLGRKISKLKTLPVFGYGGPIFNQKPELRSLTSGIFLGPTLTDAVETVNRILRK